LHGGKLAEATNECSKHLRRGQKIFHKYTAKFPPATIKNDGSSLKEAAGGGNR